MTVVTGRPSSLERYEREGWTVNYPRLPSSHRKMEVDVKVFRSEKNGGPLVIFVNGKRLTAATLKHSGPPVGSTIAYVEDIRESVEDFR